MRDTSHLLAHLWFAACIVVFVGTNARGEEVDFTRDVLPVLRESCIDCHGPETSEGRLRLDSEHHALRGGDSGEPAIVPGRSSASYLLTRIRHEDPAERMPPDADPLPVEHVRLLERWIDDAERWRSIAKELSRERVDHWSFQPIERPTVPPGAANPIDAFVDGELAREGLLRSGTAPRRQLVRRAHLVLHGLPPTPERVARFVADENPDAWERLVDELLDSPRYAERMATSWLDLVHFGETHGFETNRERPNAWPYRDWVVTAFHEDMPYDDFVFAQLAGDAVGEEVATGFLVAGPHDIVKGQDPMLRLVQRQDELADIVHTTGTAFLGMTVGCARCHNHKFDPISQSDYYALQAVFNGVEHGDRSIPRSADDDRRLEDLDREIAGLHRELAPFVRKDGAQLRPPVDARRNVEVFEPTESRFVRFTIRATSGSEPCLDEVEVFAGDTNVALATSGARASSSGDFVHPLHRLEHVNDGRYGNPRSWIAKQAKGGWLQLEFAEPATIDRVVWGRDRKGKYADRLPTDYVIESSVDGRTWTTLASSANRRPIGENAPPLEFDFASQPPAVAEQGRRSRDRLRALEAERARLQGARTVYAGTFRQPQPTKRLYRGDPSAPREVVAPGGIRALAGPTLPLDAPERERRLALAKWIVSTDNPLTARVVVNRIWQFHFGTGLVDTPSDFGANGSKPTHPELLDWLACELIDHDWSLKHVHRLILTSETWRQTSRPRRDGLVADAGSRLLWRFPPRRLEAEAIRDGMLAVSGTLDERIGGPGFSAFEIDAENVRHYHPKTAYGPEDWRRMLYMTRVRQERDSVFGVFDCPDFSQVVPVRGRSTTPLQALNLLNSEFVLQQAGFLAKRLEREAETPRGRVVLAWELCYGRPPEPGEVEASLAFVGETDLQQFARALLNSNEFVFVP